VILVRFTYKLDKAADTTVCGDTSQGGEDYGYENDLTSDSTGTVSGTVLARNKVGAVRSTCDSPYRKLVCGP